MTAAVSAVNQILAEGPVALADLAERVPSNRRAGSLTRQAVWRWATRGVRCRDGRVVRLEAIEVAGRFLSSVAALERFVTAQNMVEPTPLPTPARTTGKRRRADEAAAISNA